MEIIFFAAFGFILYSQYKSGNISVLGKKVAPNDPKAPAPKAAPVPPVKPAQNTAQQPAAKARPVDYDIPTWKRRGLVIDFNKKGKKRAARRTKVAQVQQQQVEQIEEMQEPQFEVIA